MEVSKDTVLRAWRDEGFRRSLSTEEQEAIPPRPTGEGGQELADEQLEAAAGGITPAPAFLLSVGGAASAAGSLTSAADSVADDAGVRGD